MEIDFFKDMRQFDCTVGGEKFDVYEFSATESVFSNFNVDVTLVSGRKLSPEDFIGKDALFTMIGRKNDRHFQGIVSEFEEQETRGRYFIYKAMISPQLWKQTLIQDIRIFQNLTTREIVQQVLEESGFLSNLFEFRLHGSYSPREYCVQYRETNMDFISRILAEEGIFYYYEFPEESHLLVFGDMYVCHNNIPGNSEVTYSPPGQLVGRVEYVTTLNATEKVTSGKVSLKDYHFKKPSYTPRTERKGEDYDDLEIYDYPNRLTEKTEDFQLATVHLEKAAYEKHQMSGSSICRRFTSGHRFTLTDHREKNYNIEYLLVSVEHKGKQPQALQELAGSQEGNSYSNTFKCMPTEIQYRQTKKLKKPSVMGIQTAVVTGPPGEEIYTDEFGRIKVQFHWDRIGEKDDKTSCWMRVAQPWAGSGWGSVFIPRIGQEVIVNFIDGDPDKPLVTGAVYNGRNLPPYSLPAEKTKSTIKTRSTPGGGGFNELRFEDKKGEEEIYIHGEKDWNIEILNDKGQAIGHDETLSVSNDRSKTVGNDQKESIGNNKDITVTKNHTESIGENMSVTIGTNLDEKTGENKTVDVGKNLKETVGENSVINIGQNRTLSAGENNTTDIGKNSTITIGNDETIDVGDNSSISIGKDLSVMVGKKTIITSGDEISFQCGSSSIILKKDGKINIKGVDININASGKLVAKGQNIAGN